MTRFGSIGEVTYGALIGDVVKSRRAQSRGDLQRRLLEELERLNTVLKDGLARPLDLTSGDEVQGLFVRPSDAVTVVVALSESILPERWTFGLGFGSLSTDLYENVARIDGPCFHQARQALQQARGERWLTALGFGEIEDAVLTSLFTLMDAVRGRWTEKQLGYIRAVRGRPQKEVAREFGVSPSTVSESLGAASFSAVRGGEEAARRLLADFDSRAEATMNSGGKPK